MDCHVATLFRQRLIPSADHTYRFRTRQTRSGFNIIGYTGPAQTVEAGGAVSVESQLYAGPKNQKVLADLSLI